MEISNPKFDAFLDAAKQLTGDGSKVTYKIEDDYVLVIVEGPKGHITARVCVSL